MAADAAAKAAGVASVEMQLARGIGGKAFFTVTGPLAEVEAAVEAAIGVLDAALVTRPRSSRRRTRIWSAAALSGAERNRPPAAEAVEVGRG